MISTIHVPPQARGQSFFQFSDFSGLLTVDITSPCPLVRGGT